MARKMSSEQAKKTAAARAAKLSPERRAEIAKTAAASRWDREKGIAQATHAGVMTIGARELPCFVLENGQRMLSTAGVTKAFGSGRKGHRSPQEDGSPQMPPFLSSANLKPYVSDLLSAPSFAPIVFRLPRGGHAIGYEATVLPDMCSAILDARKAGVLRPTQDHIADAAESLLRAFAKVGIIALVDEATGYQYARARDELQRLLDAFVVEEMRPWAKLFPDTFFEQVYRLHGWKYEAGVTNGPRYVGKFINKFVYMMLPAPVLEHLREVKNPVINGRRRGRHHQFLTEEIGVPGVDRHIGSVTTLMKASGSKQQFVELFNRAFNVPGTNESLRFDAKEEDE